MLAFDGHHIKEVDESGNGYILAKVEIVDSDHALGDEKRRRIEQLLTRGGAVVRPAPRPQTSGAVAWTFLFKLRGGFKYFRDADGRIGVADDGAKTPDDFPGGARYVATEEPIIFRDVDVLVPIRDSKGRGDFLDFLGESPATGIDLASRLGMAVRSGGYTYRLLSLQDESPIEPDARSLMTQVSALVARAEVAYQSDPSPARQRRMATLQEAQNSLEESLKD